MKNYFLRILVTCLTIAGVGVTMTSCGGGGGAIDLGALLSFTAGAWTPAAGFTGNSQPFVATSATVSQTATETIVTFTSAGRSMKMTLPTTTLFDGAVYAVSDVGPAKIEYEESGRSHGGFHWTGSSGSIKVFKSSLSATALNINWATNLALPGSTVNQTGSTGSGTVTATSTPVGPNLIYVGNNASNSGVTNSTNPGICTVGTMGSVEVLYQLTVSPTISLYVTAEPVGTFTPNPGTFNVRLTSVVGPDTLIWEGTAGSVNNQTTNPGAGGYTSFVSNVTMTPSPLTPLATGTFTMSVSLKN